MSVTQAEFDALYAAGPDALYALFQQQVAQQAALLARVQQSETQVGGHSQNSHRPPSSDGPRTPPRSQRERSGKRPGGQPGHRGRTLTMVVTPDQVVTQHPSRCGQCGASLAAVAARVVTRRQVVDLPPLALVVTEHQAATVCCPHCQQPTTAPFPAYVAAPVRYGPRLAGLGGYLRRYQLLPYARIRATLADLFGASPAVSTLMTASLTCAAALAPVAVAIAAAVCAAPIAHTDETSIMVAGQRQWVHVVSTATLPHYARHTKRGQAATDRVPPGAACCRAAPGGASTTAGRRTGAIPARTGGATPTICANWPPSPRSLGKAGPERCGPCCARYCGTSGRAVPLA